MFLSEFAILKAGLAGGYYVATALLAVFIVIAFFGVMVHVNRMVFGASESTVAEPPVRLPFSVGLVLVLAAVPVLVLGVYVPKPLHDLLLVAAGALVR